MNNELINDAKDQAAQEAGYNTINELISVDGYLSDNITLINRAMEIYAEMVVKSKKKKSKINPYEPTGFKAINAKPTKHDSR